LSSSKLGLPANFFFDVISATCCVIFKAALHSLWQARAKIERFHAALDETEDAGNQIACRKRRTTTSKPDGFPRAPRSTAKTFLRLEMALEFLRRFICRPRTPADKFIPAPIWRWLMLRDALVVPTHADHGNSPMRNHAH